MFHNTVKQLRLKSGLKSKDIARELLLSASQYSAIENGKSKVKEANREEFIEDLQMAIHKLSKVWVDADGLEWNRVTESVIKQAKQEFNRGKNIIQISVKYGVSDDELAKHLHEIGIDTKKYEAM